MSTNKSSYSYKDTSSGTTVFYGWKLFEKGDGDMPKTLVHGVDIENNRSRTLPLNRWLAKSANTPGFNFFKNFEDLVEYLPRFRKRAPGLYACMVELSGQPLFYFNRVYCTAPSMCIPAVEWRRNKKAGCNILDDYMPS